MLNGTKLKNPLLLTILVFASAACSSGGSSADATGFVALAITDAPVDDVSAVVVEFTGVSLKHADGDATRYDFDAPKTIDLLSLTDGVTAELLGTTEVPAGEYEWARIWVNAEFDNVYDSYAMTPTGQVELRVPSGDNSGLKVVRGFTVTADGATNLVVDWDLRKGLTNPLGQPGYHLKPTIRVVDMAEYGTLVGTVSETLVTDPECTNDLAMDTGNAVYIYPVEATTTGDIGDADAEPLVTATVSQDMDGVYRYEANFLPVADFTAAFTCQASDDSADIDDDILFTESVLFSIENGATAVVDFE